MQFVLFAAVLILLALQIDTNRISMEGYVDRSKSHMPPVCKNALEARMKERCSWPAFHEKGAHPVDFDGCKFKCEVTRGPLTITQEVTLTNGVPCGPTGQTCQNGSCVGGWTSENSCGVDFVPKSFYEQLSI
uniref:Putative ixostatin n=1 Tax=Ixodes ricinus TaxID=34613 RepID=A0A0K8RBL3_IXORI